MLVIAARLLGRLRQLDLHDNRLEGDIPEELGRLGALEALSVAGNRLSGLMPASLARAHGLRRLDVSRNRLGGEVPAALAGLTAVVQLDVGYNLLTASYPAAEAWLDARQAGWRDTQTVAPEGLAALRLMDAIRLTWTPIAYQAGHGHYEIGLAATAGGPYPSRGVTANKSQAERLLGSADPDTAYYVVVRTFSAAAGRQQNDLLSSWSAELAVLPFGVTPTATAKPKVDPLPRVLSTQVRPPMSSHSRREMASPSPVPCPTSLVVKKGSKILARVSRVMPQPLSATTSVGAAVFSRQ